MKKARSIIALILTLILCISVMPEGVFAAVSGEALSSMEEEIPAALGEEGDIILVKGQKINIYDRLIAELEQQGYDPKTKGGKCTLEDSKVVSLSPKGILAAKAKGSCHIFWSTPNKHGKLTSRYRFSFDVTVREYTVEKKTLTLTYMDQTASASDAIYCPVSPTEWKSSNPKVASVDPSSGLITARGKGSSKVSAVWKTDLGQVSASFTVKVNMPVLNKTEVSIPTGSTFTLTIKNVSKDAYFYWELGESNGTIDPVVNEKSKTSVKLTALKPGVNTYTAWVDEHPYICNITVPEPAPAKSPLILTEKKSAAISLKNTKYKAAAFTWRSTNPLVAEVNDKGKVTALKRGTATIIASCGDVFDVTIPVTVNSSGKDDLTIPVDETTGIAKTPVYADASTDTILRGDAGGITLKIPAGTFTADTQVAAIPLDQKKLKKAGAYKSGVFSEIIDPVEISIDGYKKGEAFSTDMIYTIPIGKMSAEEMESYVFAYYDENAKAVRYLYPDSYDVAKGEISIALPHCSYWWGGKLTPEEEIDAFLNTYSTQAAVRQGKYEKAAAEMEPYIRQKAEALGLRKEAAEDLIQSTINFLGSKVGGKYIDGGSKKLGASIDLGTKTATSIARAVADNDMDAAQAGFEDLISGAMQKAWEDLDYSNRPGTVFDPKIVDGVVSQTIGSADDIYKMVQNLYNGNTEGAKQDLSNILQNIHPAAELTTKGTKFLASCVNVEFTYWKANKVEELYQVYKKGNFFVTAGNKEEFLEYLNYSPGLCWSKGINRFYQMDKMDEIWQELKQRDSRWASYDSYNDLPESERNRVEKMAEDGLMEYFEIRRQQEGEAEKIKAREQLVVSTMMKRYTGALAPSNTEAREFFGETSEEDYNLTSRLERLVNVRNFLSQYVNEEELKKHSSSEDFNYGDFINEWVNIASKNRLWENPGNKEDSVSEFCQYLNRIGYLKEGFNTRFEGFCFDKRSIGYVSCDLELPITMDGHPVFGNEDDWYETQTVTGRPTLPIDNEYGGDLRVPKVDLAKIDTEGNFSVKDGQLVMEGNFNAKMKTGSGTFSYTNTASKYYYDASDLQEYIRSTGGMTGFLGGDFDFLRDCVTNCDTSTEITGTFTIRPDSSEIGKVRFLFDGVGTVNYSCTAISSLYDFNMLLAKNPKTEVGVRSYDGVKPVTFKGSSYGMLVPKKAEID